MSRRLVKGLRNAADEGFTLVEVLVALSIFAVAAAALIPLMLVSAKAGGTARLETQAKNLTQQQIERMRNLTFYVAHENGDYVDMLDLYFTDLSTAATTLTPASSPRSSTAYQDADGNVVVQYLANAGGVGGRPSGAAYRVSGLQLPGHDGVSLEVYTQFLRTTRTVATPPLGYNSQAEALDVPPAQLVGVTIFASWRDASGPQTYRTYTEMADGRGAEALLATQARSTALKVSGTDFSGNNLLAQAGVVQADGSVTSGSSANVTAEAARLEALGASTLLGASSTVVAPPSPAGSTGTSATTPAGESAGSSAHGCGWGNIGPSQVSDVSGSTGSQQPLVPRDGGTDVRAAGAKRVEAGILPDGSGGCAGYNFGFRPDADGLWLPSLLHGIDSTKPLIGIPDTGASGLANAAVRASGQVAASSLVTAPVFSTAYADAMTRTVEVLPAIGYASGLVRATLTASSLTCLSGSATTAAYTLQVQHPTGTVNINWASGSATIPSLPDPATIAFSVLGVPHTLNEYLSWSVATGLSEGDNGVSTFGPVLRLTINKDVINTSTDATLELGVLSCVADDRR